MNHACLYLGFNIAMQLKKHNSVSRGLVSIPAIFILSLGMLFFKK